MFSAPVDTFAKAVELWMGDLEEAMRSSMRLELEMGIGSYFDTPRAEWVPGAEGGGEAASPERRPRRARAAPELRARA